MGTQGRKVLVIDDCREIAELVRLILCRLRDDDVVLAAGGAEGLSAAQQDPPDLIILDLMMPYLDGYTVLERLKEITQLEQVPVLFHAAIPRRSVYPNARRLGAAGYVLVPYSPYELVDARDAALRGEKHYPPFTQIKMLGISRRDRGWQPPVTLPHNSV
jgi:CheY-like chemotaxis protein